MDKGGNVYKVFETLSNLLHNVESQLNQKGKHFANHPRYGFISTCPSNLGTGMRASVLVHLPGWEKEGMEKLN